MNPLNLPGIRLSRRMIFIFDAGFPASSNAHALRFFFRESKTITMATAIIETKNTAPVKYEAGYDAVWVT